MSINKTQLEKLLESELVCFKEILYKTQQVDNKGNSQSTESLMGLLDYRDNPLHVINYSSSFNGFLSLKQLHLLVE